MTDKIAPIGICDLCGSQIPAGDHYTRRGPRRYCSVECKNTGNSRAGEPVRYRKLLARIAAGTWTNPREGMTPEQVSAVQARASRTTRTREVSEGRWRNPALGLAARRANADAARDRWADPEMAAAMRPLPADARTGRSGLLIRASLISPDRNAAFVAYRDGRLILRLVATEVTTAPKRGRGPYALRLASAGRYLLEIRAAARDLEIPACAWTAVTRSDTEIVLGPIS